MHNPFQELTDRLEKIESMLVGLTNLQAEPNVKDRWFSVKDLIEYLPGDLSNLTIYNWTHRRIIPHHKMGKRLSFLKSEIDVWLKSNSKELKTEIDKKAILHIKRNSC